jgi:hypothetical protein
MPAMMIVAMIAAGVVQKQDDAVFPLAPTEDSQHPVPGWVRAFVALPLSAQESEFEKLCLRKQIELAVVVASLTEPPDLSWQAKLADRAPAVVREISHVVSSERSDRYVIRVLELLSLMKTLNCDAVKISPALRKRLIQRVEAMQESWSRTLGSDLIAQSATANACASFAPKH